MSEETTLYQTTFPTLWVSVINKLAEAVYEKYQRHIRWDICTLSFIHLFTKTDSLLQHFSSKLMLILSHQFCFSFRNQFIWLDSWTLYNSGLFPIFFNYKGITRSDRNIFKEGIFVAEIKLFRWEAIHHYKKMFLKIWAKSRSSHLDVFCKKDTLKIFLQNSRENTCARVSFLMDMSFLEGKNLPFS